MSSKPKNYFKFKLKITFSKEWKIMSVLQEFKCYKVTIDNINSFKKRKDKINHELQRSVANKSSKTTHYSIIDRQLVVFVCRKLS